MSDYSARCTLRASEQTAADRLPSWAPRQSDERLTVVVARSRVRAGEGVAVETRVDANCAYLVDYLEVAYIYVHSCLDRELTRRAHYR